MTATEIVAYLGAAAWVPQIIRWFYNFFTKPVVTITADKAVEVGFTRLGPIFNLRLSINVDKKDTLIDFIGVEVCHENGSKHNFEWTGMTEFFSEVKNSKGENQIVQRDIVPISIKLSTLSLTERFFRFHDSAFILSNKIEIHKLIEIQQYKRKQNKNYHDDFLNSKEFEDHLKFIRAKFYWQAGNYTVTFSIRSPAEIKLKKTNFRFELSQDNIDMLKLNLEEVKTDVEYFIKKQDFPDFDGPSSNWMWLNPTLNKIED